MQVNDFSQEVERLTTRSTYVNPVYNQADKHQHVQVGNLDINIPLTQTQLATSNYHYFFTMSIM